MAYTINLTDGSIFAVVADGTINQASSMTLVGKNYAGYGEFLDENFIRALENSANTTPPGAPLTGQLFYNKTTNFLQVYKGASGWKNLATVTSSGTAPSNNVTGDLWFDSTNVQLKVWNGTSFTLVGPASSSGQGTSGTEIATITDSTATERVVVELYTANVLVATISGTDTAFTPTPAIPGFATIGPGIQLSTELANAQFRGTATNSLSLGGLTSGQFLRSDAADTTNSTLGVLNDGGLTVGTDSDARLTVTTANSEVRLTNATSDANLSFSVNRSSGGEVKAIVINGATGVVTMPISLAVSGVVSLPSIEKTGAAGVGNIGSSTNGFDTVFARATSAQYADVAERFAADEPMEAGTVVEIGGAAEITQSQQDLSDMVFGVISTRAAYLMNSAAGDDRTHPAVAVAGRVPVRVTGPVRKGDRLVSAGGGRARAARPGEATSFNTIGRALAGKPGNNEGLVEAIVMIK